MMAFDIGLDNKSTDVKWRESIVIIKDGIFSSMGSLTARVFKSPCAWRESQLAR